MQCGYSRIIFNSPKLILMNFNMYTCMQIHPYLYIELYLPSCLSSYVRVSSFFKLFDKNVINNINV